MISSEEEERRRHISQAEGVYSSLSEIALFKAPVVEALKKDPAKAGLAHRGRVARMLLIELAESGAAISLRVRTWNIAPHP